MSLFLQFVISFGILLALICLIAAWLFRSANAPYASKFILPIGILSLAFYTPFTVANLMGYPVLRSADQMPPVAELVSYMVTDDAETQVDLWMIVDGGEPRAYRTELTASLKHVLRESQAELTMGRHVMLRKRSDKKGKAKAGQDGDSNSRDSNTHTNNEADKQAKSESSDSNAIGNDDMNYMIDRSYITRLPAKSLGHDE